ncbi:hypothetical protein AB0D32_24060 [Micromonospora sp. NPDC048170]|uniref:hypothetical protein n=1 Tax=Micromonospora sp. NPDC048170 TaxID=3154819 RepID=UPI0033FBCBBC
MSPDDALRQVESTIGREAFERVTSRLGDSETLLLSGSLVEGIGNHRSDLDFYLVSEDSNEKATQMAFAQDAYLDCERLSARRLDDLATEFDDTVYDDAGIAALPLSRLDLYYRIAIAVPLNGAGRHAELLGRFSRERACELLGQWATLHSDANTARARIALRAGSVRHAAVYANDAAALGVMSLLAGIGEGYPSLKWTGEKAARAFAGQPDQLAEVARLLSYGDDPATYVATTLDWLDGRSVDRMPPEEPAAEIVLVHGPGTPPGHAVVVRRKVHQVIAEDSLVVAALADPELRAYDSVRAVPGVTPGQAAALVTAVVTELLGTGSGGRR